MGYSKELPIGEVGKLVISEEAGQASAKLVLSSEMGGGKVHGFAKASVSAELDLDSVMLIKVGFELAKAKYPTMAPYIAAAETALLVEIAKI